jgi:branched-subunit amino acid aminotransferase/4-amino-4-deoxychorismate lyase
VTKTELKIHCVEQLDRGLAYAEACFETFRVVDGEVLAFAKHMERLAQGAAQFGITLGSDEFNSIESAVLKYAETFGRDLLVRVTVTGGVASWGLVKRSRPAIYIQCMPYEPGSDRICLAQVEWPFPLQPKAAKFTSDYALTLRAIQSWQLKEGESALICKSGAILSTPTANVLILRDGQWFAPDAAQGGVLPGVICSLLIESGLVEITTCPVSWLKDCESMLLTNSAQFVMAVSSINGRKLDPDHSMILPIRELLQMYPGVAL